MSSKKRIKWLDFAKGITILFVVLVHITGFITHQRFIHSFQYFSFTFVMPVFFAISGYLYKPTNTWKKYKILLYKKCSSFLIPYFIFTFISIFCFSAKRFLVLSLKNFIKMFYLPMGYLWFLYVLFVVFLVVGLFDLLHINFYIQFIISIILMFISCRTIWTLPVYPNGNRHPIIRICGYMICFYIGSLIKRTNMFKLLKQKWFMSISFIIWMALLLIQYKLFSTFFTNAFGYVDIVTKLMSIFVLLSIFMNFGQNNNVFNYFDKYGKYTLLIYLVHVPVILLTVKIINKLQLSVLFSHFIIIFPIMFVLAWFSSIIICYLAERIKWINFVFYPRKYIDKMVMKIK